MACTNDHADGLGAFFAERDDRNRDNLTRTASYLELYQWASERGAELPWLLLAHVVSRNAGCLMVDLADAMDDPRRTLRPTALVELFTFLERANFIIFYDAWRHVLEHLKERLMPDLTLDRGDEQFRAPRFIADMWRRHVAKPMSEREVVVALIENEQHLIENRVVQHDQFSVARALFGFFEHVGQVRPIGFPIDGPALRVRRFADVGDRIGTGIALFDSYLLDPSRRRDVAVACAKRAHDGRRRGKPGPPLDQLWRRDDLERAHPWLFSEPEPDPLWP